MSRFREAVRMTGLAVSTPPENDPRTLTMWFAAWLKKVVAPEAIPPGPSKWVCALQRSASAAERSVLKVIHAGAQANSCLLRATCTPC
jgi:hypothetical protein